MKKILFFAMLQTLSVLNLNAQVFQVNGSEKGLTSDLSPVAAGYVWGSIEGAVDISNPFAIDYKVIDCRNNDFNKVIIDGNEIYTKDGVQGNENPKDEEGGNPALTLKPAVGGTVIQIDAYENGWVYIVAKLSTNKQYMVFEDGVPMGYKIAMENSDERVKDGVLNLDIKGENETLYLPEGRQIQWVIREYLGDAEAGTAGNGLGVFYFPVTEGCTYLAHATGTKISWSGIYFSETEAKSVSVEGDGISKTIVDNPNPSPNPAHYDIWSIVGDSELMGSDWDLTDKKNKMKTTDGVNYTRKKTGITLEKGTYEYRVAKNYTWDVAYPADKAKLVIDDNATYTVTFTFNAETHELSAIAEKTDGIYYNFITKGKVAEVIANPNLYRGKVIIPATVMHEGVEYTVTKIADNAFSGCSGLKSITIPQSVTSIGSGSFSGCNGLKSVNICDLAAWCNIDFGTIKYSGCNNPLQYAHHLYLNGQEIKNLVIPNSILSIGEQCFFGCTGLTSVTISNTVTSIGDYAFSGCTGLTSLIIGNNVTSIGSYAFQNCTGLSSISIPHSVNSIGDRSFYGCVGLTSVTIGNSVKTIGYYAFLGCTGLSSIILPNSLTNIGVAAFKDCTGLTSVNIPIGVTRIEIDAFNGCSGLISIIIGEKVSSIETRAFCNCPNLTDVYCFAEKVPNTNTEAFKDSYIEYATLHIPAASLNEYNNAEPWKNFKEIAALEGGDIPEMQKCATPTIAFENGKITFSCETEGAEFISTIMPAEINKKYDSEIVISNTYKVTVYATKVGYIDSDKATIEIQANSGVFGDVDGNGVVNVADHVKLSSIIMEQSE